MSAELWWRDLSDQLGRRGYRIGQQRDAKLQCPLCRSKGDPPLSIRLDTGIYNCHRCNEKGKIMDERGEGKSWTESAPVRHEKTYKDPEFPRFWSGHESPEVTAYFQSRGISPETVETFGVKVATRPFGKTLALVYRDGAGKDVHAKYRNLEHDPDDKKSRKWQATSGTYRPMYGMWLMDKSPEQIVITEGEIDAMSAYEAGIRNVVSLSDGSNAPKDDDDTTDVQGKKLDCLASIDKQIMGASVVIIATDQDKAGDAMAAELTRRIGINKVRRVSFPDGCKDLNEVLVNLGPASVADVVNGASSPRMDGVSTIEPYRDHIWETRASSGGLIGWGAPSLPSFSNHVRIVPGLFHVVTGRAGSGKSSFLRALVMSIIGAHDDVNAAFFVPEDSAIESNFFRKLVTLAIGPQFSSMDDSERIHYDITADLIKDRVHLIHPESNSLDDIMIRSEYLILNHGVRIIVWDPFTEIVTSKQYGDNEVDHVNRTLSRMRKFAKDKGVALILAAHPTKESALNKAGNLTMYDISGAAHFANKADVGFSINPVESEGAFISDVHVSKIRDSQYGRQGTIRMSHDIRAMTFQEEEYHVGV